MSSPSSGTAYAAIDFLVCLILVALVLIAPPAEPPSVEQEGKYLLIVQWPDSSDADIDTYVQVPDGEILYFSNRNAGLAHLNRDDLGALNDKGVLVNEERVVFRGTQTGEYIVNLHYWSGIPATRVTVEFYKLKGPDALVRREVVTLERQGVEKHLFRVRLNSAGDVTRVSVLPKRLVGEVLG